MNGLIVIDKPPGITSHDVVNRLRRIAQEQSIGHLGTLDPMATGVLPLLLGKFTRLAQWFAAAEKSYSGAIRFGWATDTYDADGEPLSPQRPQTNPHLSLDAIRAAAAPFHGQLQQMPPPFSAKKIAGTPAYKLARQGKPVELKPATVTIDSFEILSLTGAEAEFTMRISAGGYVRSVAHELGPGARLRRASQPPCAAPRPARSPLPTRTPSMSFSLSPAIFPRSKSSAFTPAPCCRRCRPLPPTNRPSAGSATACKPTCPDFSDAPIVKVFAGQRDLFAIAQRVAGTLFQPIAVLG